MTALIEQLHATAGPRARRPRIWSRRFRRSERPGSGNFVAWALGHLECVERVDVPDLDAVDGGQGVASAAEERFAHFGPEVRAVVSEPLVALPGLWHEVPAGSGTHGGEGPGQPGPFHATAAGLVTTQVVEAPPCLLPG